MLNPASKVALRSNGMSAAPSTSVKWCRISPSLREPSAISDRPVTENSVRHSAERPGASGAAIVWACSGDAIKPARTRPNRDRNRGDRMGMVGDYVDDEMVQAVSELQERFTPR